MRFPRQTKVFRGPLDAAPFAGVFFCLVLLLLVHSSLVFPPGIPIELPVSEDLPGLDQPATFVGVDGFGRYYFENQVVSQEALQDKLRRRASQEKAVSTLVIQADRTVAYEKLIQLSLMAKEAGFQNALLATRTRDRSLSTPLP